MKYIEHRYYSTLIPYYLGIAVSVYIDMDNDNDSDSDDDVDDSTPKLCSFYSMTENNMNIS